MPATYRLTLQGHVGGGVNTPLVNVFGYHDQLALPVDPSTMGANFIANVLPAITTVTSAGTAYDSVLVEQVLGGTFFNVTPVTPTQVGQRSGEQLPVFNAWGFQYNRAALGKRSGSKRFSIITEPDQNFGNPTAGIQPALDALASVLGTPLKIGLVDTWFPVILERPKFVGDTFHFHDISNVTFTRVTTQSSRKSNR